MVEERDRGVTDVRVKVSRVGNRNEEEEDDDDPRSKKERMTG